MARRKPQEFVPDPNRKPKQVIEMTDPDGKTRNKVYDSPIGWPRCNTLVMVGYVATHPELEYYADGRSPLSKFKLRIPCPLDRRNRHGVADQYFRADTIIDCYIFNRGAENTSTWLTKNRMVLVEGNLNTHYWKDPKGAPILEKPIGHFIYARRVMFLDKPTRHKDGRLKEHREEPDTEVRE